MIELTEGNLLQDDVEALVNTVNCVGVMGKGIALQFKLAFPENYKEYRKVCDSKNLRVGQMFIHSTGRMINPKYIINFPTKRHWRAKSSIEDVRAGLHSLIQEVKRLGITSVAVPPLGCGNGQLQWSAVRPLIEEFFAEVPDVSVHLYPPHGAPKAEKMPVRTRKPKMTRARALFVKLIEQYSQPGYRLTLLELQKLAYFLQNSGENLRLRFVEHHYGPYADNLNHVLQVIEGHFIRGYGDRSTRSKIRLLPEAALDASALLEQDEEATTRLKRVERLIEGFESPYGMELLATVHWVVDRPLDAAANLGDAITKVFAWNERKRELMKPDHIRIAWQRLDEEYWLQSRPV
jgi:O-acetyl-ADP-ribose deacetylase (regulator of RNase III)